MPATFAHPAAVLPLRRFTPAPLHFAALVIGTITPDVGYFVPQVNATAAHTFSGSFVWCLPSGLLLLLLFLLVRRPLWFLLPEPHRSALQPLVEARRSWSLLRLVGIVVSVLLGAWTHILWDSFTHETAYFVQRWRLLREAPVFIRNTPLAGYYILQQLSTLLGSAAIAVSYFRWLRRQKRPETSSWRADLWRYVTWAGVVLLPFAVALPHGLRATRHYNGFLAARVFVFQSVVVYLTWLVLIAIAAALLAYGWRALTKAPPA